MKQTILPSAQLAKELQQNLSHPLWPMLDEIAMLLRTRADALAIIEGVAFGLATGMLEHHLALMVQVAQRDADTPWVAATRTAKSVIERHKGAIAEFRLST